MYRRLVVLALCLFFQPANVAESTPQSSGGQRTQTVTSIQAPNEQPKQDVLSALRTLEQERVAKSAVPVLLLSNIRDFVERSVIVEDMYYSAFFKDGTQSISVQGSRLATKYANLRPESNIAKKRVRSTDGFITESERIWTASWKEFGAAYVLSVECAKAKDKRCESEDHVTRLANSLVYVGGGRITAENRPRILPDQPEVTSTFTYNPPGQLLPGSGTGRQDNTVYAPDMRFPIENKPAYANSQVYNRGGNMGPPGGQCDTANYSFPWWDNFCEKREWNTPMCPNGKGHQGQDVRPSSCVKDKHFGVSATDGKVTYKGTYSVFITGTDGTKYRYLHMSNVAVNVGDTVSTGNHIGQVSNVFGGVATTIHLHFEILQNVEGLGYVHVPPYMSLVKAYEKLP